MTKIRRFLGCYGWVTPTVLLCIVGLIFLLNAYR